MREPSGPPLRRVSGIKGTATVHSVEGSPIRFGVWLDGSLVGLYESEAEAFAVARHAAEFGPPPGGIGLLRKAENQVDEEDDAPHEEPPSNLPRP